MPDTKDYIKYIDNQPSCLTCHNTPTHHHLEAIGMGNNRKRQTEKDYSCVPLCVKCHQDIHTCGIETFERVHHINLWKEAFRLLRRYYDSTST